MTPESMAQAFQDYHADGERQARVAEEAEEQRLFDELYGDLVQEPDTCVRGLP